MKKILFLIIACILLIPISVYAKENVVPDIGSNEYSNVKYLPDKKSFNYLELKADNYTLERLNYYNNLLSSNMSFSYNVIYFDTSISFYSEVGEKLETKTLSIGYETFGNSISSIYLNIGGKRIIGASCFNNSFSYLTDDYFDVNEYNSNYKLAVIGDFYVSSYSTLSSINYFKPDLFLAMIYEYSGSSDIYIPMFSDLTIEEIVNEVGLEDDSSNRLLSYEILESDYIINSNIADYSLKIRGYNKESKAILKWIYIHVIDISNIARSKNFQTSYKNKIDDLDIIDGLDLKNDYIGIKINTEYHYGSKRVGKYRYIADITFNDMNFYLPGFIEVFDNDSPYALESKELITVSNKKCLSKEDILKNFVIYDDSDGTISNIELDGLINYLTGYSTLKDYEITLNAYDSSGNKYSHKFIIRVTDKESHNEIERYIIPDYVSKDNENNNVIEDAKEEIYNPVISNSNYIIRAYTTHKLTTSEVQDLLISEGYLNNNDNVVIDSDYFRESNPKPSTFSLSVTYENGDVTYYEINLVEKEIMEEEEESHTGLIVGLIVGGIAAIATIIIVIMKVYVHVKKN